MMMPPPVHHLFQSWNSQFNNLDHLDQVDVEMRHYISEVSYLFNFYKSNICDCAYFFKCFAYMNFLRICIRNWFQSYWITWEGKKSELDKALLSAKLEEKIVESLTETSHINIDHFSKLLTCSMPEISVNSTNACKWQWFIWLFWKINSWLI